MKFMIQIAIVSLLYLDLSTAYSYKFISSSEEDEKSCEDENTCDAVIDMVFLFDESGSIPKAAFDDMKLFMKNIVNLFDPVGQNGAQFAAICFSSDTRDHFFLNNYTSAQSVKDAIDDFVVGTNLQTAIGKGLRRIQSEYFKPENGGQRSCAIEMIVVITDGKSNTGEDPVPVAGELKGNGTFIFAVGVGASIDSTELEKISSGKKFVHTVVDFKALNDVVQSIVDTACENSLCTSGTDDNDFKGHKYRKGGTHIPIVIDLNIPIEISQTVETNQDNNPLAKEHFGGNSGPDSGKSSFADAGERSATDVHKKNIFRPSLPYKQFPQDRK